MKAPWEYWEQMSELLYVTDVETNELLYLNRSARKAFSLPEESNYLGRKCYSVLQGRTTPCLFCTYTALKEGAFYEWTHCNPVLNRTFLLQDTLLRYEGRLCRMEIAFDLEKAIGKGPLPHHTAFLTECLMISYAKPDPNDSLNAILEYLGIQFHCSGVMIYQVKQHAQLHNTNSWSLNGSRVNSKSIPLDLSVNAPDWYRRFIRNEPVILTDPDAFRSQLPTLYSYLSPVNIQTMALCPLLHNDAVTGFLRLDNPSERSISFITSHNAFLSNLISAILQRQALAEHSPSLSNYDPLTHTLNRHALDQYMVNIELHRPIGVIFCDIADLKSVNDSQGHSAGDELILKTSQLLLSIFSEKEVYRIGGDEFLVVCGHVPQQQFEQQVALLRRKISLSGKNLSVGSIWNPGGHTSFESLMKAANQPMHLDKQSPCQQQPPSPPQQPALPSSYNTASRHLSGNDTAFTQFIRHYYFDQNTFLESLTKPDTTYIFCGDLEKNVYFISDNLREDFHFPDNLVYDFVSRLEERIYEPDRAMHVEDMRTMLREKKVFHNIRYRIYDKDGALLWIHCRGNLKWSPDGSKPVFFSGTMVSFKSALDIDSITGLPTAKVARNILSQLLSTNTNLLIICFALNGFDDINHTFGRELGDQILHEIGAQLDLALGEHFHFYRLDGIHFMATSQTTFDPADPTAKIHEIVKRVYLSHKIHLVYPCAIGILCCPEDIPDSCGDIIDTAIMAAQCARSMPERDYLRYSSRNVESYNQQIKLKLALNYCVKQNFQNFQVVIQPQVRTRTQDIYGGEVLLRWSFNGSSVSPAIFIPILEQSGLIVPVGKWVVNQAVEICKHLIQLDPDFCLSFNVSYAQIMDSTFIDCIHEALARHQVPGRNLILELTETHFDEMPEHLTRFIQQCRALGLGFALDDFGSGYSSLQLLLHYPADLVKLDRSLIQEATSSKEKFDFLMSIVYACRRFGKLICIEGVETLGEFQLIQQTGCDFIQGFYFYRPMKVSELCQILSSTPTEPI